MHAITYVTDVKIDVHFDEYRVPVALLPLYSGAVSIPAIHKYF